MLRKQLVVGTLALVTGMLGYSTILPAAPSAVVVDSSDVSCISAGSEVDSLTVADSGVRLEVNGSCSGSAGTPSGLIDIETIAIDEGTDISIDLAEGVTVKLPYSVSAGTSTITKETPKIIGTTALYKSPVPGTVAEEGGTDSFDYTFDDANGTVTKTVYIPINWVDPEVVSGDCVDSETVMCMGLLPKWPSGTMSGQRIGEGQTHVWYFDYDTEINQSGKFILFDGSLKTVSVSLKANDSSTSYPCKLIQLSPQSPLNYAPAGQEGFWECPMRDGRYYLNIRSTDGEASSYSMTVR